MLFPFLLALLIVATLALFFIGAMLAHQQRSDVDRLRNGRGRGTGRRPTGHGQPTTVVLGHLVGDSSLAVRDEHALAKLRLEAQARRAMADIIG